MTASIRRIFHPTDLGKGSATAFLHALRLAVATRSTLTILHVSSDSEMEWSELPGVRSTLARWGLIKDAQDMDGLTALGVGVRKVIMDGSDPAQACLEHLEDHPADLIVLSTHQQGGRTGWLKRKVAEPLARGSGEPCLLVPHDSPGFLDAATGAVRLRRVLVPMAMDPDPRRALGAGVELVRQLGIDAAEFTLLHVGDATTDPMIELPAHPGWSFQRIVRQGDVVGSIVHVAEATRCDALVMATKGHDGFLDALRGSTTERVLRAVHCPVLAVPA